MEKVKVSSAPEEGLFLAIQFLGRILTKVKVKVKFSLERAMKAQRGSRGIALLFL
jgi:hypothetical protein